MPNKKKNNAPKNAFYFFMVSLRPQLERQGVVLENGMQSLAEIAGPRWKVGVVKFLSFSFCELCLSPSAFKLPYPGQFCFYNISMVLLFFYSLFSFAKR